MRGRQVMGKCHGLESTALASCPHAHDMCLYCTALALPEPACSRLLANSQGGKVGPGEVCRQSAGQASVRQCQVLKSGHGIGLQPCWRKGGASEAVEPKY